MPSILEVYNKRLLSDINRLLHELKTARVQTELAPYKKRMLTLCDSVHQRILNNLNDLKLEDETIIEDILSNTQQVTQIVRLISSRMMTPVLRSLETDRLCLKTIAWLHNSHPATIAFPPVFTDGDCSVWPFVEICPIYFFPVAEQRALLYLPLYFHEFGHLLYRLYDKELDSIVKDLQLAVSDAIVPPSKRSDAHAAWQESEREDIANTWYKWSQELFCDSVGITIGGPAFLRTFSMYLSSLGQGDFYKSLPDLKQSEHPVGMIRMRLLKERAYKLGITEVADKIITEWEEVAHIIGITKDYYGFYDDNLLIPIQQATDDMLNSVKLISFEHNLLKNQSNNITSNDSPVLLCNKAWELYLSTSEDRYENWEKEAIKSWVDSH